MSFWMNYTGRRDEYPLPDVATNRSRLNMPNTLKLTANNHNKQHDVRAASFRRMAKQMRAAAKANNLKYCLPLLAKIFEEEAKLLRSMR